jgi:hypothetical protein
VGGGGGVRTLATQAPEEPGNELRLEYWSISLDISRTAATSLLTCGDGGEGPHLLVIALVEGSALIVAGQQWYWVPFDNFVRLLMKYRG